MVTDHRLKIATVALVFRRARECRRFRLHLEDEQHGEHKVAADAEGQPSCSAASESKQQAPRSKTGLLIGPATAGFHSE